MYLHLYQHYQGTPYKDQLAWGYAKTFLNLADESVTLSDLAEAQHFLFRFWTVTVNLSTRAKLLKPLAGVCWRLARQYVRGGLRCSSPTLDA